MIDLRSDTVSQPSEAMMDAIAGATHGDGQKGDDPTVLAFEERAAELLGQERAVLMPTATMANQIALRVLTEPGDAVVADAQAHIFRSEAGGPAAHSGLTAVHLEADRGVFDAAVLSDAVNVDNPKQPRTRVIGIENTHNGGGGRPWPRDRLAAVCDEARAHDLRLHLDGSRLFNAAVAQNVPAAELAGPFDTVTICLSKGLGCPLGAALACSERLHPRVWRAMHLYGGAMRQPGIIAAAGLYALEHNVMRLGDDHRRARSLAEGWVDAGLPVPLDRVETNFVQIDCSSIERGRDEVADALAREGVRVSPAAPTETLRAVTHLDVTDADVEEAIRAGRRVAASLLASAR